jgi:serine/threonine protein kinase
VLKRADKGGRGAVYPLDGEYNAARHLPGTAPPVELAQSAARRCHYPAAALTPGRKTRQQLPPAGPITTNYFPASLLSLPAGSATAGDKLTLGRNDDNDIVVRDDTVSGRHCELKCGSSTVLVKDLGSTNGVCVNGRALGRGGSCRVRAGDELELGDAVLRLELVEGEAPDEDADEEPEAEDRAAPLSVGGLTIDDIRVLRRIGGGSFGTVFEGTLNGEPIVLKQANGRVEGAKELLALELQLNQIAAQRAPGGVADYIGAVDVPDSKAGGTYAGKLSAGLWLAWRWEGSLTLGYYLQRRAAFAQLAEQLGLPSDLVPGPPLEAAVTREVIRQTLLCLDAIHTAGLVHCDVKPQNLLVTGDEPAAIRLIDLGGAASCLNPPLLSYAPGEGVHDPLYSPPETNLLSDDAKPPTLRNARSLWKQHRPELFDAFSVGVVLMQLACPRLRTDASLQRWREELSSCDGDLWLWRERKASPSDEPILSMRNDAGWDLAAGLLRPQRKAQGTGKGAIPGRLSPPEALKHPFLAEDAAYDAQSTADSDDD